MTASLEKRFTRFLASLPGAEAIDGMVLPEDPERRRKADFLLAKREVVLELKTLTVDTSHKVEAAVDKHRERDEFPLFYGTAEVRNDQRCFDWQVAGGWYLFKNPVWIYNFK